MSNDIKTIFIYEQAFMSGAGPQCVTTYSYTVCWAELLLVTSERQEYLAECQTRRNKKDEDRWTETEKENHIFIT